MGERVVIEHPQEPGRPTTIARHHYDPKRHRLWKESAGAAAGPVAEGAVEGYRIEQVGSWWKVFGVDGSQVGKSQRSQAEAEQLRDGLRDADRADA